MVSGLILLTGCSTIQSMIYSEYSKKADVQAEIRALETKHREDVDNKVKEVQINDHKSSAGHVSWTDIKIKLEGSQRWYTDWNFRKCTPQEVREIGLKSLFDEKVEVEVVGKHKRKFDYYSPEEKVRILLTLIIESANDRFRNKMNIIDWTINKTGEKYSLKLEDFESVKNLTLLEILDELK